MSIKTLHITNSYHPSSGGIRTFYNALLEAANRHRRPVRLVVPAAETSVEEVGEFGRIYQVAAPRVPVIDSRYRWMLPHTYAWPYESTLRRIFAVERPDLVEICDKFWLLYLASVLRRGWIAGVPVPVIVGLTCERLDENMRTYISDDRVTQWVCERYMQSCYVPRFDFHIAASDYIAAEIRGLVPRRLHDRLHVCPMGVDFGALGGPCDASAFRRELLGRAGVSAAAAKEPVLLLYAGRLSKEKNLGLLPAVLAALQNDPNHDYRLVVAGEGPSATDLGASLESAAPGRSLFLGHCDRKALVSLYHATNVFIHPNPREPFGIAPLEAMAAGLPLVAPASGGVLTYANRENAWLADDAPNAFAEAARSIGADCAVRCRKIEKARATAALFSWPRVTAKYFHLYDHFHKCFLRETFRGRPATSPAVSTGDPSEACSI
jgi:glycosyltransferase involved in cell wall biosynthesis